MAITFLFCALFARFFFVQVCWSEKLVTLALKQWNRSIPVVAARGKMYSSDGVALVENTPCFAVFVRSRGVMDKGSTAKALANVLSLDEETLYAELKNSSRSELTLARGVDKSVIERLAALNLDGVYFSPDGKRNYPYSALACQTLGFTSSDNSGQSGLEGYYNSLLSGRNGKILQECDLVGVQLSNGVAVYQAGTDGMNANLTIDCQVQQICEEVMANAYASTKAKYCGVIVMEPSTCNVLAAVNYPSYDLNSPPRSEENFSSLSRNRLFCDSYEPGSTFKIFTAAADIEEFFGGNKNALSLTTHVFSSAGTRTVDGTTVKCWTSHINGKHANQTLAQALNNSCNPCFVDMALALGKDTMYEYLNKFGFGSPTGIDFSGESSGMVTIPSAVRNCDLARISFGQSVAVTPVQLATAACALVNGGTLYTPRLVTSFFDDDGNTQEVSLQNKGRVVSERTSSLLRNMLQGVVSEGSGKLAYIEGYEVGGKTGTAQKYENGRIAQGKYVASFLGFFPASAPKYLALVVVDEPQGVYYGSQIAAPLAKEIFEGVIRAKNILPNESKY